MITNHKIIKLINLTNILTNYFIRFIINSRCNFVYARLFYTYDDNYYFDNLECC